MRKLHRELEHLADDRRGPHRQRIGPRAVGFICREKRELIGHELCAPRHQKSPALNFGAVTLRMMRFAPMSVERPSTP
jgi:hypothetical protein